MSHGHGFEFDHRRRMSKRKADGVATTDGEVPASRTAQFNQDVRALNLQFASWVEKSKSSHPNQLWDAGIRSFRQQIVINQRRLSLSLFPMFDLSEFDREILFHSS